MVIHVMTVTGVNIHTVVCIASSLEDNYLN